MPVVIALSRLTAKEQNGLKPEPGAKPAERHKTATMKTKLSSTDIPEQLEGFSGGMGFKSIAGITEYDLGFEPELDVKGYISEPVNGVYYAEVRDGNGNVEYACGEIDEMQKWLTDTVYLFCKD